MRPPLIIVALACAATVAAAPMDMPPSPAPGSPLWTAAGAFLGVLCWAIPRTTFCRAIINAGVDKLLAPIVAVSALLLYEDLATSMFSQATYRYFHITEPYRLVLVGFGIAFVMRIAAIGTSATRPQRAVAPQTYDLLDRYFGQRRSQWICFLIVVNASLFAWWTSSMLVHTGGT